MAGETGQEIAAAIDADLRLKRATMPRSEMDTVVIS